MERTSLFLFLMLVTAICPAGAQQAPPTGDWCGNRDWLADCGITFDLDIAHFYQGVTTGGLNRHFRYGGHGDYVVNFDLG